MKTSLCAKLMSLSTPYTIVYPSATSAIIAPCASPVRSAPETAPSMGSSPSAARDGRAVGELPALDLNDDDGLLRVAVGVDVDGARRALEAFGLGDGVLDGIGSQAGRARHRVVEQARRVIGLRREARRIVVVSLAVGFHELLRVGPGHVGRVVVREVGAFELGRGSLQKVLRVP